MAKSKTRRNDREYDMLDRLKQENKKLKRELSALRKIVDRVDLQKYENMEKLVKQQRQERKLQENKDKQENNKWLCHRCSRGRMTLEIWPRLDGLFYNRVCSFDQCDNRTKLQKYHDGVEKS